MAAQAELTGAEAELEKQRDLNERLENDLLQVQSSNPAMNTPNGDALEADALAGLDLGKRPTVSDYFGVAFGRGADSKHIVYSHPRLGTAPFHSPPLRIRQYCLS